MPRPRTRPPVDPDTIPMPDGLAAVLAEALALLSDPDFLARRATLQSRTAARKGI